MEINLTWDLFFIILFAVTLSYSYIIGHNSTCKVLIATYIAILTADGMGNLINKYLIYNSNYSQTMEAIHLPTDFKGVIILKVVFFMMTVVLLSIRGGFHVRLLPHRGKVHNTMYTSILGFFSAGLIFTTIIIFTSGNSLIFSNGYLDTSMIVNKYAESKVIYLLVENYSLMFTLPALFLVLISYFRPKEEIE